MSDIPEADKKPPEEIYLNINDDCDMPPLHEVDWNEVTWSPRRPDKRQAIRYVSYDLAKCELDQARAELAHIEWLCGGPVRGAIAAELAELRKDKARLDWLLTHKGVRISVYQTHMSPWVRSIKSIDKIDAAMEEEVES